MRSFSVSCLEFLLKLPTGTTQWTLAFAADDAVSSCETKIFTGSWEFTDWRTLSSIVEGDIVMVERVDHTVALGNVIDLPCAGVLGRRFRKAL